MSCDWRPRGGPAWLGGAVGQLGSDSGMCSSMCVSLPGTVSSTCVPNFLTFLICSLPNTQLLSCPSGAAAAAHVARRWQWWLNLTLPLGTCCATNPGFRATNQPGWLGMPCRGRVPCMHHTCARPRARRPASSLVPPQCSWHAADFCTCPRPRNQRGALLHFASLPITS